jgi:hypothetical protein
MWFIELGSRRSRSRLVLYHWCVSDVVVVGRLSVGPFAPFDEIVVGSEVIALWSMRFGETTGSLDLRCRDASRWMPQLYRRRAAPLIEVTAMVATVI